MTWALLFASACVYDPPSGPGDDPTDPSDPLDPADPNDPRLGCMQSSTLLCLELEHGLPANETLDLALDSSGNGFDARATLVETAKRVVVPVVTDDSAAGFVGASSLVIDEQIGIANSVTVELWAQHATSLGVHRLFDSSGRIYLGRNQDNQIECGINGGGDDLRVDSTRVLGAGSWHHLACVFDASTKELKIVIDGSVDDCTRIDATIDTARTGSTMIGFGFLGVLDSVHVYARALSPGDLCANAGRGTSCAAQCPTESGGGFGGPGG